MKNPASILVLLAVVLFSAPMSAEPITIPGPVTVTGSVNSISGAASIHGRPDSPVAIGVLGTSHAIGVQGNTSNGIGVAGTAVDGVGGMFTVYGAGVALTAKLPDWYGVGEGGIALSVDGPIEIKRNQRSRMRVYNPTTGALVGEFEFEVVLVP